MAQSIPIRLGIVGCGAIAEGAHIPAALSSRMVEITVLSDPNRRRLLHLQRRFGLKDCGFVDYRETFGHVDAIILALPNHLHKPVGVEFLSRGIHVLCEKPLATDSEQCQELCEAAHLNASVLAVGYVTRFYPSTELTKQLIEGGFLGTVHSFDYEFGTEGGWAPLSGYNLTRQTAGGGVLLVSGSHFFDRMIYVFPDVEIIRCVHDGRGGVEANCKVWLKCAVKGHPVEGRITVSKTHKLRNRLCVVGERGRIEIGESQSDSVTYFPADSLLRHEISCDSSKSLSTSNYFHAQIEDFASAVRNRTRAKIDGETGTKSVALIEKCYHMAEPLPESWVDTTLPFLRSALPV
jgi:predicted dehydrogenase